MPNWDWLQRMYGRVVGNTVANPWFANAAILPGGAVDVIDRAARQAGVVTQGAQVDVSDRPARQLGVVTQPVGTTMYRGNTILTATILNGAALSEAFDMSDYAGGILHMPAAWTAARVGFQVSPIEGGIFQAMYQGDGVLAQMENDNSNAIASFSYALPAEMFGVQWVRVWSQNGAGVGVNQGGDRVFNIDLKA